MELPTDQNVGNQGHMPISYTRFMLLSFPVCDLRNKARIVHSGKCLGPLAEAGHQSVRSRQQCPAPHSRRTSPDGFGQDWFEVRNGAAAKSPPDGAGKATRLGACRPLIGFRPCNEAMPNRFATQPPILAGMAWLPPIPATPGLIANSCQQVPTARLRHCIGHANL